MLKQDNIKKIIDECKILGASVRVRDIAYVLLSQHMEPQTAFQCIFATTEGYAEYSASAEITILADYMARTKIVGAAITTAAKNGITFEENRAEMERLLIETQRAMDEGLLEPKDGLKIQADIRTRLNDKFAVTAKQQERSIVVERKYNAVCETCHHEIYVPTKEDLMEKYGLTEKK